MEKMIYKYPLELGNNVVEIPNSGIILTAQIQGASLCMWVMFDKDDVEKKSIIAIVVGTGHDFEDIGEYLSTVQMGPFVWHVFIK